MTGMVGYPGGQSFPFTAGSGYTAPAGVTDFVTGGVCALNTTGGTTPQAPAMGFNLSGGAIINAYPTILGSSVFIDVLFPGQLHVYRRDQRLQRDRAYGQPGGDRDHHRDGSWDHRAGRDPDRAELHRLRGSQDGGPFNGLNGTYVIDTTNSNITGSLASETMTSGPTGGSGAAISHAAAGMEHWTSLRPKALARSRPMTPTTTSTGTELYDNSGVSGNPLAGKFALPQGGLESPGLPVHPFGMRRGAGVSG